MSEIQPYHKIVKLSEGLYVLDGEWYGNKFARRMTIIKLLSNELIIHNPIKLKNEDYSWLDALGTVRYVICPNKIHASEPHHYERRYPQAQIFVAPDCMKTVPKKCKVSGVLPQDWPVYLKNDVLCMEIKGTRFINEIAVFHKKSKTLILTDAVFNMQMDVHGFEKLIFKFNRVYKTFGPSRLFRSVVTKNWGEVQNSFREILNWDFDRVIMNHGQVLETGGKAAIQKGFEL